MVCYIISLYVVFNKAFDGDFFKLHFLVSPKFQLLKPETSNHFFFELCVTIHLYSIIFNAESIGHSWKVVEKGHVCIFWNFRFWNLKHQSFFLELCVTVHLYIVIFNVECNGHNFQVKKRGQVCIFFFRSFRFWNLKSKKNLENNTHFLPKIRSSWKKYPIIAKKNNSWQKNTKFLKKNNHSTVVKNSQLLPTEFRSWWKTSNCWLKISNYCRKNLNVSKKYKDNSSPEISVSSPELRNS